MKLDDLSSGPFQLTNTLDEFESNPIWLSQSEIAYLSWRPGEGSWFLNILSTSEGGTASRRVMEIPSSWYWSFRDDER